MPIRLRVQLLLGVGLQGAQLLGFGKSMGRCAVPHLESQETPDPSPAAQLSRLKKKAKPTWPGTPTQSLGMRPEATLLSLRAFLLQAPPITIPGQSPGGRRGHYRSGR